MYLDADFYSDHKLVICKCFERVNERKLQLDRNTTSPKRNFFDLQRLLDNDLTSFEINWENLKTSLLSALSNVFPKQKKQNKDWFDEND